MSPQSRIKLNTGNEMPVIGLGTWQLRENTAEVIAAALKMGYPMIDTSGDYGTQAGIAEGIKQSGLARRDFYLVTKVEETDDAYDKTLDNLDELQLDYADLMLIHRPPENGVGVGLWQGLIQAQEEGIVKDIGVSNYSEKQIRELYDASGVMPAVNQIEWSPFGWSQDMLDFCYDNGIVIQAYSPLTRGEMLDNELVTEIAARHRKTPAQVLLRWNLQMGTVPLPKANQIPHLKENLDIFDFELADAEMEELCNLDVSYSALGPEPVYIHDSD